MSDILTPEQVRELPHQPHSLVFLKASHEALRASRDALAARGRRDIVPIANTIAILARDAERSYGRVDIGLLHEMATRLRAAVNETDNPNKENK